MKQINKLTCGLPYGLFAVSEFMLRALSYPIMGRTEIESYPPALLPKGTKKVLFMEDLLLCQFAICYFHHEESSLSFYLLPIDRSDNRYQLAQYVKLSAHFLHALIPEPRRRYFEKFKYKDFYVTTYSNWTVAFENMFVEQKMPVTKWFASKVLVGRNDTDSFLEFCGENGVDQIYSMINMHCFSVNDDDDAQFLLQMARLTMQTQKAVVEYVVDVIFEQFDAFYLNEEQKEPMPFASMGGTIAYEELITADRYVLRLTVSSTAEVPELVNALRNILKSQLYCIVVGVNSLPPDMIRFINQVMSERTSIPDIPKPSIIPDNLVYFKKNMNPMVVMYPRIAMNEKSVLHNDEEHTIIIHDGVSGSSIERNVVLLNDLGTEFLNYFKESS